MVRTRSLSRAAAFFVALASPAIGLFASTDAPASVSVAVTWDNLLHESSAAAFVSSLESHAVWEDGRIFTYTHVKVDRPVAGELGADADAWIRTLGGVVGNVGQIVEGEAVFSKGESSLVFMRPGPAGTYVVTARGQGQFPVVATGDPKLPKQIMQSHSVGMIVPPRAVATKSPRLATELLAGRPVEDVVRDIAAAWASAHAK